MNTFAPRAMALAIASAFAFNTAAAAPAMQRAENAYLSESDAMTRSARVSNVDYVLDFTLTGKESFAGTTTVSFDLKDIDSAVTLDLNKATVKSLSINGKPVAPSYNQWFLTLAPQDLVKGKNTVTVSYERLHSTNGEGLHRMVDPVDGRVYTYSHFEPAAAHQMFAVFDQPDLKATYTVTVNAPADWHVVTTTRENKIADAAGGKRWTFPTTKKLSPYNFSLHAGPYQVWEDKSGKYPMRLFARQSVAKQVTPADWFRYTKSGLTFFDDYFGIPYQFEKYDQLLVPDFLYGAMENAAAITFAEGGFLYKAEMTPAQKARQAEVIMHEMAHQWFGDLVTMKWWNGLWLNESFASFMATLATAEATEFKDAWQSFYQDDKQGAYAQDQKVSTHPIEVPVPSSSNAFDNIDAITYSKGASTLKQLRHMLGEEVFRKGVHNYLVKYSWQNAKLEDFIGSLGDAAGRDLSKWTQDWLYQAGVNTVAANYSCSGGKISSFSLQQTAASKALPTLREQRVQVAAFKLVNGKLVLAKNVPVTYAGANTRVPGMVGAACPDLVYPNYQDWGFVKVQLDKRSFATARTTLAGVDDPLLRAMLWQSLWDGVRDGKLALNEFIEVALANAPQEKDYTLLGDVLGKVGSSKYYLDAMGLDNAYAKRTTKQLEDMAWQGVLAYKGNDSFQRRWFATYMGMASSPEALARLAGMLEGRGTEGLNIGQDQRWAIIARLNRYNYQGAAALVEAESLRDKSDTGQGAALAATVVRPDPKVKAEWLANVEDLKTKLPFSRVRTAMGSMYPTEQKALAEQTAAARLARLPAIDKAAGPVFMRSYAGTMIPASCTPASVQRLERAAQQLKDLSAGTRRSLLDTLQEDQRCVAIQKAMTAPKS
ncbi:aminopeptidase N [Massilia yuzhufengensis]|uniref:Aminopeptidase N n=1 Tax=Massilia yuzhufengensis TaxID=1164594 RepID=A0A1I1PLE3_9BURK|nr:aminopeptidase N [Massilia yuzhufengensis]SFD10487.1 Membrane alanyl aminopeptidase Metallo peptidase. MEROPS family M01 [Massilia yuzhufengensis]